MIEFIRASFHIALSFFGVVVDEVHIVVVDDEDACAMLDDGGHVSLVVTEHSDAGEWCFAPGPVEIQ